MQRAVTAIYRTYAAADLVRRELRDLGIPAHDITVLPDQDVPMTQSAGRDVGDETWNRLHDLHLPDDDARTYQEAVRNGDHVVSVSLDDDAHLQRVHEIMRNPEEAHDIDSLDSRYAASVYEPRRDPLTEGYSDRNRGFREPVGEGSRTRQYGREEPLPRRDRM